MLSTGNDTLKPLPVLSVHVKEIISNVLTVELYDKVWEVLSEVLNVQVNAIQNCRAKGAGRCRATKVYVPDLVGSPAADSPWRQTRSIPWACWDLACFIRCFASLCSPATTSSALSICRKPDAFKLVMHIHRGLQCPLEVGNATVKEGPPAFVCIIQVAKIMHHNKRGAVKKQERTQWRLRQS